MPEPHALWIISDVLPDGTFAPSLTDGGDRAVSLCDGRAAGYATAVASAAARAQHDAAVLRQITELGTKRTDADYAEESAFFVVSELRSGRADLVCGLEPDVSVLPVLVKPESTPGVMVTMFGVDGFMDVGQAMEHAAWVLAATEGAELDRRYCEYLQRHIGLDEPTARGAVGDLGEWLNDGDEG